MYEHLTEFTDGSYSKQIRYYINDWMHQNQKEPGTLFFPPPVQ